MARLLRIWFDKAFQFKAILADVGKRPFIMVGMSSFLLLLALAITSPSSMIRRLGGKRWNRLHRLAYIAAAGGALHFYTLVKADTRLPWAFAGVLGVFLAYRVLNRFLPQFTERKPACGHPPRLPSQPSREIFRWQVAEARTGAALEDPTVLRRFGPLPPTEIESRLKKSSLQDSGHQVFPLGY